MYDIVIKISLCSKWSKFIIIAKCPNTYIFHQFYANFVHTQTFYINIKTYMDFFNNLVLINLKPEKNLHVCEFMMKHFVFQKQL